MTDPTTPGGGMRSTGPTADLWPPPESLRPTVIGDQWMISAGHPLTAAVGASVFEQGGTAIDAGVAAGIASSVVQPDMCNLGGVAPLLVKVEGEDEVWSIAGLGPWGADATLEEHLDRYGGEMPAGGGSAIVPAAAAAWTEALRRFGTWSFEAASKQAAGLAREGFPIDRRLAESLEICSSAFMQWPSSREIYAPDGIPLVFGRRLVQTDLGRLLERMATAERSASKAGASRDAALRAANRAFYEGEVAERIARFVGEGGGWMTTADLASFEAEVEPAVRSDYRGWSVAVNDTWCQGPALLQALAVLDQFDLGALGHNTPDYLHVLAEAIKLSFSDRERYYGDPRHVDVPLDELLSESHARKLASMIKMTSALPNLPTLARSRPGPTTGGRHLDTTYLCAADARGNAISATMSDTLDGGPVVPGLGIVVSPRGVQSRLDPTHPAVLAPGKRPRLTPAPALALRPEAEGPDRVWPFGCPGGDVILQGMLQSFLNVVHFEMTPQEAVEAPRIGAFSYPDSFFPHVEVERQISIEARIDRSVCKDLSRRGHQVVRWPEWEFDAGGVSMICDTRPRDLDHPVLAGAADPRRSCYAIGR